MQEAAWDEFLASNAIEPLTIVYEDMVPDFDAAVRRVLEHVGVRPEEAGAPTPDMERQSDSTSDEWVARYLRGETERPRV